MKILAGFSIALLAVAVFAASAEQRKTVYVQFIRGTDQGCNGAGCRAIGPKLSQQLSPVFRWKNYWEVDRRKLSLEPHKLTKVELPGDRKLELQMLTGTDVEARLYRKTGLVTKTRHTVGSMSILGGEEPNRESFFVVIRRDEPTTE